MKPFNVNLALYIVVAVLRRLFRAASFGNALVTVWALDGQLQDWRPQPFDLDPPWMRGAPHSGFQPNTSTW
jgi:hypothetical protein